jgi:hypothetical protein
VHAQADSRATYSLAPDVEIKPTRLRELTTSEHALAALALRLPEDPEVLAVQIEPPLHSRWEGRTFRPDFAVADIEGRFWLADLRSRVSDDRRAAADDFARHASVQTGLPWRYLFITVRGPEDVESAAWRDIVNRGGRMIGRRPPRRQRASGRRSAGG